MTTSVETQTPAPAAPVETVTPMKASEAIRLGVLYRPTQAFGEAGDGNAACVIATAMAVGYYGMPDLFDDPNGSPHYPACPAGCERLGLPLHLNDDHRWSRERIADWLESRGL